MRRVIFFLASFLAISAAMKAQDSLSDTLREAVVTATRVAMEKDRLPAPIAIVSRDVISVSDQNAVMPSLMENVPGLFVTSRGVTGYGVSGGSAGAISIRGFGAGSGRTLILLDGHPQYQSIYGHAIADEYIAETAQRVEVTRGAASVLYGSNAMGGAINIITREPSKIGNSLSAKLMGGSYGTFRASVTDTYYNGRFSLVGNINYDTTAGHRENSAFNSTSGMLKAGYKISDAWKITANGNIVKSYSENPGTVASPMFDATADILRWMTGLSISNEYENTSGSVNFYYNGGRHDINDGHTASGSPQPYLFHSTDFQGGVNAFQAFHPFTGNTLTAGVDVKIYGGNAYRNPTTEIYADHKRLSEKAVYLLDQQQLGKFFLDAGARVENHSLYGTIFIPEAGISFMPWEKTSLKLSASKGFRTPNIRELYMYMVANEDLLPEEAWSYDFTVAHHFLDGRLNAEFTLFKTKGSNIIEVTVVDGKRANRNVGEFENNGVELSADFKAAEDLVFNANYSYLDMGTVYVGVPVHKAYLGGTWTPGRFSFHMGAMGIKDLYLSTGENPQMSSYIDLNARASFQITDFLSVFARGQNLLNQEYQTMLGFPEPGITLLGGISVSL